MSRRDSLHDAARRTLEKDGWIITDDPLILVLDKTLLKADLGAEKFFIINLLVYEPDREVIIQWIIH